MFTMPHRAWEKILEMVPSKEYLGEKKANNTSSQRTQTNDPYLPPIVFTDATSKRIESMEPKPSQVLESEEGEEIFGSYTPMQSPGTITVHWQRIGGFFWQAVHQLCKNGAQFNTDDLKVMAAIAVGKTYYHEQFHHFCDVARHLHGTTYDKYKEEAMAVAWSYSEGIRRGRCIEIIYGDRMVERLQIQSCDYLRSPRFRFRNPIARAIQSNNNIADYVALIYNYRQRGYRDWKDYFEKHQNDLMGLDEEKIIDYTGPQGHRFLQQKKIWCDSLLCGLEKEIRHQGVDEVMLP